MTRFVDDVASEDAILAEFVELARRYASARKESDLAAAFLARTSAVFPCATISIRAGDLDTTDVRAYVADGQVPNRPASRVDATAVLASAPEGATYLGFTLADGFEPDTDVAPLGCDIPVFVDASLLVVVSVAYADRVPDACCRARLLRFGEQFADALSAIAERGETARLRLYAGSIVDRTNVPIAVMAPNGNVRLSNEAFRATVGISTHLLSASILFEQIAPLDRRRAGAALARAFRGSSALGVEIELQRRGTAECRMLVDFEPIPSQGGGVDSVLVVGRDVTRVRQLEDQVTHADRLATLGQLAAGVVHELNNPLTSILVYTEYLLRKAETRAESEGEVDKLRRILAAAERIQEFARNLVAYSRSERGERTMLSVTQVLDQALAFCEPIIDRANVIVRREYDPEVPSLIAVRGQLQQVFINLVTNACHAVAEAGGVVHVHVTMPRPSWVEIRIEDNGPGIAAERRSDVFRPFVTTKPSGQGTGLGLSIVRNLVERHGGTVEVEVSPLGGACFVLMLPLRPKSERPIAPTSSTE